MLSTETAPVAAPKKADTRPLLTEIPTVPVAEALKAASNSESVADTATVPVAAPVKEAPKDDVAP